MSAVLDALARYFDQGAEALQASPDARSAFDAFLTALERGEVRAAYREGTRWLVDPRVKQGILVGFRLGTLVSMGGGSFVDKDTWPIRSFAAAERIRLVPGGSSVRRGAFVAPGVTIMPPAYINAGAYVGEGTLVDSHALVGSCAQIGARVHLSAAAQIGGVLEPVGALPVIVEDDVLVGGNVGIYEGTLVRARAVIGAGVVLTASTRVYDLVEERVIGAEGGVLEVPEGAVVVPGSRPAGGAFAATHGLQVAMPLIVKYRDARTDARTALESALR